MKEEQIIKKVLKRSREQCPFKKALLNKGWTCINIEIASKCIAKELKDEREK